MKIDCDECGEQNDPGLSRCAHCGSILPVTLALDTNARPGAGLTRGARDYRQRPPVATSSGPPVRKSPPSPAVRAREMPFEVEDDWDEDVFTSIPADPTADQEPRPPAAEPPAVHPLPSGPLAYVPGKGLVPRTEAPASAKRAAPPPVPSARKRAASREPLRTAALPKGAKKAAAQSTGMPPRAATPVPEAAAQEPTLVAVEPVNEPLRDEMVAALGATFAEPAAPAPPKSRPGGARRGHSQDKNTSTQVAIAVPVQSIKLARLDPAGSDAEVRVLELGRFLIGREDGDILLRDTTVSPWHAQISVRRNGVFLRDMRSLNGVFVRATGSVALWDRGLLRVGAQTLRYRDRWDAIDADRHGTMPLGGPKPPRPARVEVLGPGGVATAIHYVADTLLLGRTRGDLRFADDDGLSPEHARFQVQDKAATVTPLGDDPVYVQLSEEVELLGGAIFLVGDTVFRVDF